MPRFGSITSPTSYRPSYSGGTYRSAGIKREAPLVSTYTSRYSTLPTKETVREVSPVAKKTIAPNSTNNMKSTRFASTGNLSAAKSKPIDSTSARVGRPAITVSRIQSRNPSPLSTKSSYSRSRSRDPSPSEPPKDRFVSSSGYAMPSSYNKLYSKSSSYGNKLGVRGSNARGISSSPAISYMTARDTSVRIMKRQTEREERSSKSSAERSPAKESSSNDVPAPNEMIEMVEVTVVTRGTSPTLCSTTNYSRSRRIEVAKTVEKTIMRPRKMAQCDDKEVQSDRLDDTSKYCRFNSARAPTPWSPYLDSKLSYSRFGNGSSSVSPSKTPSRESPENGEKSPSKSRESSVTSKSSSASSRSSVPKSTSSTAKSSKSKSKTPPIALAKQKSPSTKSLPPPAPKSEFPSKISTSSAAANGNGSSTKWANKDFRKSALNVGPTDRPRKMRHSSADTDSEENRSDDAQRKSMSPLRQPQQQHRTERSPSVSSELSCSSGNNNSTTNEIAKVFAKLKLSGVAVATANAINNEKTMTNPTITTQNGPNESCAKNETKSPSPMAKIFTNASSITVGTEQQSESYAANEDDVLSICENIERIAIESALDQTNPTTETILNNRKSNNFNQIDASKAKNHNWTLNSTDEQTTSSASGGDGTTSTCQLFLNSDDSNALNMKNKLRHIDSGELPWWMTADDDNDTTADDITLNQTESETQASADLNDGTRNWLCPSDDQNRADDAMPPPKSMYRITQIRSGERAWWMDNDGNDGDENGNRIDAANNIHEDLVESDISAQYTFKIKRIESGEKAWWMTNDDPETENTENIDFWSEINQKNEQERMHHAQKQSERDRERNFNCDGVNDSNGPLGHRASPEGLEDFNSNRRRFSPYPIASDSTHESFGKNAAKKMFISRHQNIDDLLGGTSHTMNLMLMEQCDNSAPLEEILPNQVRIHDGTAHMPYMHYIGDER